MAATELDIASVGGDVVSLAAFFAAITADVDLGSEFVGTIILDESVSTGTYSTSNANDAKHRVKPGPGVRHNGSCAEAGARIFATGSGIPLTISSNDLIVEDLLIGTDDQNGNRAAIVMNAGSHRTIIRRNGIVQLGAVSSNRNIRVNAHDIEDVEISLNNFFNANVDGSIVCGFFFRQPTWLVTCNTFAFDDARTGANCVQVAADALTAPLIRGCLAIAVKTPTGGEYVNDALSGSTKNAGSDGTAAVVGTADIDIEDDLSLTIPDMLVSTVEASVDMRRKAANHDLGSGSPQEIGLGDLGIGNIDVTGKEFNPLNPIMGADQLGFVPDVGGRRLLRLGRRLGLQRGARV